MHAGDTLSNRAHSQGSTDRPPVQRVKGTATEWKSKIWARNTGETVAWLTNSASPNASLDD